MHQLYPDVAANLLSDTAAAKYFGHGLAFIGEKEKAYFVTVVEKK